MPHAPRPRASYSSPLIDACEEMAQALIDSPILKMPVREEGMKMMTWIAAVFELYEDSPFLKVDMVEFKKHKARPIVQQLDFLYRKLVDPSRGYPDFHAAVIASRYGGAESPQAPWAPARGRN